MKVTTLVAASAVLAMTGVASAGFYEDFNGGGAFPWTVVDYDGASYCVGWDYNYNIIDGTDPRGNFSSGDLGAAHVDTDIRPTGVSGPYDIAILSPSTVVGADDYLTYVINFQQIGTVDNAYVEISTDAGANWTELMYYNTDTGTMPDYPYDQDAALGVTETIGLANYVGETVMVQFRYQGDGWNWWMQVDNVGIIPAPSSIALLGLAGLVTRRRR
ncbi:MAG: hypothetical protein KAS72_03620 [Phycisphaerales bacterium]|nr:hypothetical protein [Phycisphaerales bacterium]